MAENIIWVAFYLFFLLQYEHGSYRFNPCATGFIFHDITEIRKQVICMVFRVWPEME